MSILSIILCVASAILYVQIDFHLTAGLLCNVNLYCFNSMRAYLLLAVLLSVLKFPYFGSQVGLWNKEELSQA